MIMYGPNVTQGHAGDLIKGVQSEAAPRSLVCTLAEPPPLAVPPLGRAPPCEWRESCDVCLLKRREVDAEITQ